MDARNILIALLAAALVYALFFRAPGVQCSPPNVELSGRCCLDADRNLVCDDEMPVTSTTVFTTSSTTLTHTTSSTSTTTLYYFTCDDGVMNGDEEGIDCGGYCSPCRTVFSVYTTDRLYFQLSPNGYARGTMVITANTPDMRLEGRIYAVGDIEEWTTFTATNFFVEGGQSKELDVIIRPPPDAARGVYNLDAVIYLEPKGRGWRQGLSKTRTTRILVSIV